MCNKYNGWTNYETWNYALWNDPYSLADEFENDFTPEELNVDEIDLWEIRSEIAKRIEEMAEEFNPLQDTNSFYSDVLSAAISSVNWYEIADAVIKALRERNPIEEPEEEVTE